MTKEQYDEIVEAFSSAEDNILLLDQWARYIVWLGHPKVLSIAEEPFWNNWVRIKPTDRFRDEHGPAIKLLDTVIRIKDWEAKERPHRVDILDVVYAYDDQGNLLHFPVT